MWVKVQSFVAPAVLIGLYDIGPAYATAGSAFVLATKGGGTRGAWFAVHNEGQSDFVETGGPDFFAAENSWAHVAVVLDSSTQVATLYSDGQTDESGGAWAAALDVGPYAGLVTYAYAGVGRDPADRDRQHLADLVRAGVWLARAAIRRVRVAAGPQLRRDVRPSRSVG